MACGQQQPHTTSGNHCSVGNPQAGLGANRFYYIMYQYISV